MAVKLTHLKSITNDGVLNTYQLILDSLFGGKLPEPYNPNLTYKKGDSILVQQEDGTYKLQVVKKDEGTTTGSYKPGDWTDAFFTGLFKEGSALDIDFTKTVQISDERPTHKDNVIWIQPTNVKPGDGSNIELSGDISHISISVFKNEYFTTQSEKPEGPEVKLWFDEE